MFKTASNQIRIMTRRAVHLKSVKRVAIIAFDSSQVYHRRGIRGQENEQGLTAARLSELAIDERMYSTGDGRMVALSYFPLATGEFPSPGQFDAVIIPGAPMVPSKMAVFHNRSIERLADFILEVYLANKPLLGICFGHEAIGSAFECYPVKFGPEIGAEIGFHGVWLTPQGRDSPLFEGVPETFGGAFFHQYYLPGIPESEGAVPLAKSIDGRVQAFQLGSLFGVQFHPDFVRGDLVDLFIARQEKLRSFMSADKLAAIDHAGLSRNEAGANHLVLLNFLDIVAKSW